MIRFHAHWFGEDGGYSEGRDGQRRAAPPYFITYKLISIAPAPGWMAILAIPEKNGLFSLAIEPITHIAIANTIKRWTEYVKNGNEEHFPDEIEEYQEIVGIGLPGESPTDIVNLAFNFGGLLGPGSTLADAYEFCRFDAYPEIRDRLIKPEEMEKDR